MVWVDLRQGVHVFWAILLFEVPLGQGFFVEVFVWSSLKQ